MAGRTAVLLCAAVCLFAAVGFATAQFEELNSPISDAIFKPQSIAVQVSSDEKHGYYRKAKKEYTPKEDKPEYKPKPKSSPKPAEPKGEYNPQAPEAEKYYKDGETYEKDGYYLKDGYYYKEPEHEYYDKPSYDNYKKDYDSYGKPNWFPKICLAETTRVPAGPIDKCFFDGTCTPGYTYTFRWNFGCCKSEAEEYPADYYKKPASGYYDDDSLIGSHITKPVVPAEPIGYCDITIKNGGLTEVLGDKCTKLNVTATGDCKITSPECTKCIPFGHLDDGEEIKFDITGGHVYKVAVGLPKAETDYDYYGKYPYALTASSSALASAAKASIASVGKPAYDEPSYEEIKYSESGEEYTPAPYPYGGVERGIALVLMAEVETMKMCEGGDYNCHHMKKAGGGVIEVVLETVNDECKIVSPVVDKDAPLLVSGLTGCESHGSIPMCKYGQAKLKVHQMGDYGYGYDSYDSYEKKGEYKLKGEYKYKEPKAPKGENKPKAEKYEKPVEKKY